MTLTRQIFINVWDDTIINVWTDVSKDTIVAVGKDTFNSIHPVLLVPVYESINQSIKNIINEKLSAYDFTR